MVTAIIIKYKRVNEVNEIVRHLSQFDFIDEIKVWDNTRVNIGVFGRFKAMSEAKNEHIYIQDDDCIVNNVREMFNLYDGSMLVNAMKKQHACRYGSRVTLLGWGAFINREWIKVFDKYIEKYGEDDLLYREADRIFTAMLPVPRITVCADVTDYPSAMGNMALSLQPGHEGYRVEATKRCECLI